VITGALSAIPFGTWAAQGENEPHHVPLLIAGFVAWQICAGCTLFWFTYQGVARDLPAAG
jgi:hypothetical protein